MKVLVCGGREFNNYDLLKEILDEVNHELNISVIIEGDSRGADKLSEIWAINNGIFVEKYPADWNKFGKAAGFIRNKQMLTNGKPDLVIAFKGGNGTNNMVEQAMKNNIQVIDLR